MREPEPNSTWRRVEDAPHDLLRGSPGGKGKGVRARLNPASTPRRSRDLAGLYAELTDTATRYLDPTTTKSIDAAPKDSPSIWRINGQMTVDVRPEGASRSHA